MRIVHYLAQLYCALLAISETVVYFSSKPKNDIERFAQDVKGVVSPEPLTNLPLILSTVSIGMFLAWLYAMGRKKEGLKMSLLVLTFVLAIAVIWVESPFFN